MKIHYMIDRKNKILLIFARREPTGAPSIMSAEALVELIFVLKGKWDMTVI